MAFRFYTAGYKSALGNSVSVAGAAEQSTGSFGPGNEQF